MADNKSTRDHILSVSGRLFLNYGYEKTTMTQISKETGLALGNINYYFRKKIDILNELHRLHTHHITSLITELIQPFDSNSPVDYLKVHFSNISLLENNDSFLNLYIDATKIPEARRNYIDEFFKIQKLLYPDTPESFSTHDLYMFNTVLCSSEFDTVYYYSSRKHELDLDELLRYPMTAYLMLLGYDAAECVSMINTVISHSKEALSQIDPDSLFPESSDK